MKTPTHTGSEFGRRFTRYQHLTVKNVSETLASHRHWEAEIIELFNK
jgi:hypothetical protein